MRKTKSSIKIIIIDSREIILEGLKHLLDNNNKIYVAGTFLSIINNMDSIQRLKPDIVLLGELEISRLATNSIIREIKQKLPGTKVIILMYDKYPEQVLENLISGADGYIPKDWTSKKIAKALTYLKQEGVLIPRITVTHLVSEIKKKIPIEKLQYGLTKREFESLELLSQGKTNKEIGNILCTSEKTVKNYLYSLYQKLGVKSRTEAISKFLTDKVQ